MEKPILFNTEMVQAILLGKKTQTRRIMKKQSIDCGNNSINPHKMRFENFFLDVPNEFACPVCGNGVGMDGHSVFKSPYQVGDTLWVRETWAKIDDFINYADLEIDKDLNYLYKCDDNGVEHTFVDVGVKRWRPSIHMPRAAARLFLKITDIRVERLRDISEDDALKEGFQPGKGKISKVEWKAKDSFEFTWNEIYKNWTENPWVWVIEFEKVEG